MDVLSMPVPLPAPKRRRKAAPKADAGNVATPKAKPRKARLSLSNRFALAGFSVAGALVTLSLCHLTEGIASLTGSHWFLSLLLAVGIDAGMAVAEGLLLLSPGESEASRWAGRYVVGTLVASALLNAYAFTLHAPAGWGCQGAAVALGLALPLAVFALLKGAGKAYLAK